MTIGLRSVIAFRVSGEIDSFDEMGVRIRVMVMPPAYGH